MGKFKVGDRVEVVSKVGSIDSDYVGNTYEVIDGS